jgi:Uncharacterized protein conserved in bacteria (DUF2188)
MTVLHVVPDELGNWRVFDDAQPAPLSEHWTATHAESAALSHARTQGDHEVIVHDRYGRTHQPVGAEHRPASARAIDARDAPPPGPA